MADSFAIGDLVRYEHAMRKDRTYSKGMIVSDAPYKMTIDSFELLGLYTKVYWFETKKITEATVDCLEEVE